MHSEIHLRQANWVEPDFLSRYVWQTWGHPRERAACKVILKDAEVRSRCLRSCDKTKVSQRQEYLAWKGWEQAQWQQSSPTLERTLFQMYSYPTLPQLSKWQLQPAVTLAKDTGLLSFPHILHLLNQPAASVWCSKYRIFLTMSPLLPWFKTPS